MRRRFWCPPDIDGRFYLIRSDPHKRKTPGRINLSGVFFDWAANYFLQHFAQPAASVQHFMHVAWSLQQLPSHFMAAGLEQEEQLLQPVLNNRPTAQTAPSISIFILTFPFVVDRFVGLFDAAAHVRHGQIFPFRWLKPSKLFHGTHSSRPPRPKHPAAGDERKKVQRRREVPVESAGHHARHGRAGGRDQAGGVKQPIHDDAR